MPAAIKAPSGRRIWKAVRDELMLNLYPLPFSTLAPSVFRIYLHPDDFEAVEPIAPRIVDQVQRAPQFCIEVESLERNVVAKDHAQARKERPRRLGPVTVLDDDHIVRGPDGHLRQLVQLDPGAGKVDLAADVEIVSGEGDVDPPALRWAVRGR